MIELMILGALVTAPMSGYEIKQMMGYTSDYFFKVSNGSLYPTLRRFEKNGLIIANEVVENGRCKIIYEITEDGYQAFVDYVSKPLRPLVFKDEILIRMYFASILPQNILHKSVEQKLKLARELRENLEKIKIEHWEERDKYKYLTYQFGRELADLMDRFYQKMLDELNDTVENGN